MTEPIEYRVPIVSKPSNLGVGLIWYFVCPVTGKHCKKLYGASKYFLHREAFKGCMYECQTWSKNSRALIETMKWTFAKDNFMEGRWKYMKTHYRGKPTKTYLKYLKLCQKEAQMLRPMRDLLKQIKKS